MLAPIFGHIFLCPHLQFLPQYTHHRILWSKQLRLLQQSFTGIGVKNGLVVMKYMGGKIVTGNPTSCPSLLTTVYNNVQSCVILWHLCQIMHNRRKRTCNHMELAIVIASAPSSGGENVSAEMSSSKSAVPHVPITHLHPGKLASMTVRGSTKKTFRQWEKLE